MIKFDIQISISGNLEWICDIYQDNEKDAIADAVDITGGKYVGHHKFAVKDGAWIEVK